MQYTPEDADAVELQMQARSAQRSETFPNRFEPRGLNLP